jgi:hypothetical protein
MREPQYFGVCCYRYRAVAYNRCTDCKPEYGCPLFESPAELKVFYRLIPPSMLGAPLPLNLWPNLWRTIEPSTRATGESPVQLLAGVLGLASLVAFPSLTAPERALNDHSQEI